MKFARTFTSALLLLAGAVTGHAQSPLTREQVAAELREAIRTGDMLAPGDSGVRLNQLHPQLYPATAPVAGKTRSEVQAELADAVRSGDIVAGGESGLTMRERFPQLYPAAPVFAGRTRADVRAETLQAIREGDIVAGESGLRLNEEFPQRYGMARSMLAERADARRVARAASQEESAR